jgi:hypothetical protein
MLERGWGALSAEDWGKGIPLRTVNKQAGLAGEPLAGAGLRAAGRQATIADTTLRTVSRLFFFFFFSLPLMREQLNYT